MASRGSEICFEKTFGHTLKKPDYVLEASNILFEVKEFRPNKKDVMDSFGGYDPIPLIREKIAQARKKFRDFKGYCCNLVLYNCGRLHVELGKETIYSAMLGNSGVIFQVPSQEQQVQQEPQAAFLYGGAMIDKYDESGRAIRAANTTISAIIVLRDNPLRTLVCENPVAKISLTEQIFCGPFDVRYGYMENRIDRKFAGQEILKSESSNTLAAYWEL